MFADNTLVQQLHSTQKGFHYNTTMTSHGAMYRMTKRYDDDMATI